MKAMLDKDDKTHVKYDLVEIPAQYKAQAEEYHHHLLEAASHADDHLLELVPEVDHVVGNTEKMHGETFKGLSTASSERSPGLLK